MSGKCKSGRISGRKNAKSSELQPSMASSEPNELSTSVDFDIGDGGEYTFNLNEKDSDDVAELLIRVRSSKATRLSIDVSDSEDEKSPPPKKKAKKKAVKDSEEADPMDRELVLMILWAEGEGNQRVILTHTTMFTKGLDIIHNTIGCTDVGVKPTLTYKLSNTTKNTEPISLASANDWKGYLQEVTSAETPKKAISVKILVSEQYMVSLHAKLSIKSAVTSGKGKKKKLPILDLEHAGSSDDDFDEGVGIMEKERTHLEQLQTEYSRCQHCRPTKACKIDISSNHHSLSNGQQHGWVHSLAIGTHNVTLKTPPNDDLFGMFFKNSKHALAADSVSTPIVLQLPFAGMGMAPYMAGMPAMLLYRFFPPWSMPARPSGFNGHPPTPGTPTPVTWVTNAPSSTLNSAFPSSDPLDMGALNPYTEITEFLQQLNGYQPKRCLLECIPKFDELDFYNINEIVKLQTPQQIAREVNISLGNATYILEQVKVEMKRIDHAAKARA